MKYLVFWGMLMIPLLYRAQIVNTEQLRINDSSQGWSGNIDFSLNFTRNTRSIVQAGMRSRLGYRSGKHRLMFFNQVKISRANEDNLINEAFQHLRYNYVYTRLLTAEVFSQVQYNQVQKIGLRSLLGLGPRFSLLNLDSANLHLGCLYMYEYEQQSAQEGFMRSHRLSMYASAAFAFNKIFTINHITYYQPRIDHWADFRISSESSLGILISKRLTFRLIFQLLYDTRQPEGIPPTTYALNNSLGIRF